MSRRPDSQALLSFTIALNAPDEYDGGGTWYEARGADARAGGETIVMPCGGVTFRAGSLRHRGMPVTRGERYFELSCCFCRLPSV